MEHTGTTATPDVPSIPLTDSVSIPQVGFGVFQISASTTQQAVEQALEIGYRHIDTAAAYYNEREVGDALKATGMTGKVFVTSKLRNCDQGYDAARVALDTTLNNLGLDHLDLYLIHWPFPAVDQYVETWKALLEIQQEGTIRAGGVSNFLPEHLQRLIDETGKTPAINQLEVHPSFSQTETLKFCKEHGIVVEAYSPLGHGSDMKAEPIQQAAERMTSLPRKSCCVGTCSPDASSFQSPRTLSACGRIWMCSVSNSPTRRCSPSAHCTIQRIAWVPILPHSCSPSHGPIRNRAAIFPTDRSSSIRIV